MKLIKNILFIFIGFIAGIIIAVLFCQKSPVTITFKNDSSKQLKSAIINNEGRNFLVQNINVGDSSVLNFHVKGESSYSTIFTFDDGTIIKARRSYIESGYNYTEIIDDSTITLRVNSFN